MKQLKETPTLDNISINDTVQVYCDIEQTYLDAKVLEIKENETTKEKLYYIHFLNLEKRMDKWVEQHYVLKNYGHSFSNLDGANFINHSLMKDNIVLTRKQAALFMNESDKEEEEGEEKVKIRNIEKIIIGYYSIEAWYFSPYPSNFTSQKVLYICEHCLKYFKFKNTLIHHLKECEYQTPPGKQIYEMGITPDKSTSQKENRISYLVSIYEILGSEQQLFCQNLCLIAKLFLDHKSIYFDVSPFKFYVLYEKDNNGYHIVGYFSKEMSDTSEFNLSCIMILPPFQRKGYGQFLISLSYFLSNRLNKISSPETPLSDLGKLSYKSYWTMTILNTILKNKGMLNVQTISEQTGIRVEDINYTLNELSLIKYWKGQQVIQNINIKQIEEFLKKKNEAKKSHIKFDPKYYIDD